MMVPRGPEAGGGGGGGEGKGGREGERIGDGQEM